MVLNLPSIFTLLFVSVHGAEADVHLSACCCVSLFIVLKLATTFQHCVSLSMVLKLPSSFNHCVSLSMVLKLPTSFNHCVYVHGSAVTIHLDTSLCVSIHGAEAAVHFDMSLCVSVQGAEAVVSAFVSLHRTWLAYARVLTELPDRCHFAFVPN